jgi:hypothetical protein
MRAFTRVLATSVYLFATSALSQTINYSELASGDLDGRQSFALGVGINTIEGTLRVGEDPDFDPFRFAVPAAGQLESFSLQYSVVLTGQESSFWGVGYGLASVSGAPVTIAPAEYCDLYNTIGPSLFPCTASPIHFFVSHLPLGPDLYELSNPQFYQGNRAPGGSIDYSLRLTVSPISEVSPTVLLPFGLALVLGALHRRSTRRALNEA